MDDKQLESAVGKLLSTRRVSEMRVSDLVSLIANGLSPELSRLETRITWLQRQVLMLARNDRARHARELHTAAHSDDPDDAA